MISKTMKVILTGLLVFACIFAFAGAASASENTLGDVYKTVLYEQIGTFVLDDTQIWSNETSSFSFVKDVTETTKFYVPKNVKTGTYVAHISDTTFKITVKEPTAIVNGYILDDAFTPVQTLIDNAVSTNKLIRLSVPATIAGTDAKVSGFLITNPDNSFTSTNFESFGAVKDEENDCYIIDGIEEGVWTIKAYFKAGEDGFATIDTADVYGTEYKFTVVKSTDKIVVNKLTDPVYQNGFATIEVCAPTGFYDLAVAGGEIPDGQVNVVTDEITGLKFLNIGYSESATFVVKADEGNLDKVTVRVSDGITVKMVDIKVLQANIKINDINESVYIGGKFNVSGTNDLSGKLYFYIQGNNYPFELIEDVNASGKVWETEIDTTMIGNYGKKPDAGMYTIYAVYNRDDITSVSELNQLGIPYASTSVTLSHPFISISSFATSVVKGDNLIIRGIAEGKPSEVQYYIFGQNIFVHGFATVNDDGTFEINRKIVDEDVVYTDLNLNLSAGQYFIIIQHPMFDQKFNVGAIGTTIYKNTTGSFFDIDVDGNIVPHENATVMFNVANRQSDNAAMALCDTIKDQNIDDMYVKGSFSVVTPHFDILSCPSEISEGEMFTISGTSAGYKNEVVIVEIVANNFDAMSKEESSSSVFVTTSSRVAEDGTWVTIIDTSKLDAGTYAAKLTVGTKNEKIGTVTIKATTTITPTPTTVPTVVPTVIPVPTQTPTQSPTTPGFSIILGLIGIGMVGFLMTRRN